MKELAARPMTPVTRDRYVPKSLKAYASMVSSADKGSSENHRLIHFIIYYEFPLSIKKL